MIVRLKNCELPTIKELSADVFVIKHEDYFEATLGNVIATGKSEKDALNQLTIKVSGRVINMHVVPSLRLL